MTSSLKTTIVKTTEALAFQINTQSPKCLRYLKAIGGTFVATNGWQITAKKMPELNVLDKRIFLRGTDDSKDNRVDRTWGLPSNAVRDLVANEVQDALNEFSAFVDRFSESKDRIQLIVSSVITENIAQDITSVRSENSAEGSTVLN